MPRHTPRVLEHRRTTRRSASAKAEFGRPPEVKQATYVYREQWMQVAAKEYFSPFACRQ